MRFRIPTLALLLVLAELAGCASTKVTQQMPASDEVIAPPHQIWVYDFAATPRKISSDSHDRNNAAQSTSSLETGRQLGALIANDLVLDIRAMGLSALQAGPGSLPQVGDDVIRGYVVLIEAGGIAQRFIVGFGAGASEVDSVAEDYLKTSQGLRKIGSWTLDSSGSKTPGIVVPAVMAIALGNPLGLIIGGGMRIYGEVSGIYTVEGREKATADKIADELSITFQRRNWIS